MNTQLFGAIVAIIIAVAPAARSLMLAKVTPERLAHVTDIARLAVRAAEELGQLVPEGTNAATAKLDYASSVVTAGAKRLGFRLSSDEVLAFVHTALGEMKQLAAAHDA